MATYRQFYAGDGVPLTIDVDPASPGAAWIGQRDRMRGWLATVDPVDWSGPTRCAEWDLTHLVRHLASGSQFLGYTLHQAAAGTPTTLLREFDTHTTVQAAAELLGELTPTQALDTMTSMDAAVAREVTAVTGDGWMAVAESPAGHLAAHLVVSHFLFDSWIHEYDMMLPRGLEPTIDAREVEIVTAYLIGLALLTSGADDAIELRMTEPDLVIGVTASGGHVRVAPDTSPTGAAVVEGRVLDVVNLGTGRPAGPVAGDARGLAALGALAALLGG